jgi:vitamin B12 transporter
MASARPLRPLWVSGSYTFLRTRIDQAEPVFDFASGQLVPDPELGLSLLRRPRHSGTLSAVWQARRYMLSLDATFIGRRRDRDPLGGPFDAMGRPIFNDGYSKVNLAGSVRLVRSLTLFARVENVLNQSYQEVLGYPAYRINFSAGLRFTLGGDR